ncbi:MAG TPA: hypothetical protein VNO21_04420 [Polyangiaceae bacterium]|nr:hypothetical protein [Polyangiaceae bacterium]
MYLTAHHVQAPTGGAEGINAFRYEHGKEWDGLPPEDIPDRNPGRLVKQTIVVPPPGNYVRSYLDVVTSDAASPTEIRQAFVTFVSQVQLHSFPWSGHFGRVRFRVEMDQGLAGAWRHEIAELYRAIQHLVV